MKLTSYIFTSKMRRLILDLALMIAGLVMLVVGGYSPPVAADCPRMNAVPCTYNVLTQYCGLACQCGTTACCYRECGDCVAPPVWQGQVACAQICGGICDPNWTVGP